MAEFMFRKMVEDAGCAADYEVASAATSTEELGNPVYPPARRTLAAHGISCNGHSAHQITRSEYDYYDLIVCMDRNNLRNMRYVVGEDTEGKVIRLLDLTDNPRDVADPWYTGNFDVCYRDILEGLQALMRL